MVTNTQVSFLVGANYGVEVDFKKISSPVKPGFGGFLSREKVYSS
jgi:hypothetical protein